MGILFVIALLVLSFWMLVGTFKRLRGRQASRAWWAAFGCLVIIGLVLGYWFSFHFEYHITPSMRVVSFPMPLSFFHFENGHWVDFPTPEFVMYPGLAANVIASTALAVLPVLIASLLFHRSERESIRTQRNPN
jgi:heme A synthase